MKPIFSANHRLRLELARRQVARGPLLASAIKAPPDATFPQDVIVQLARRG